MDIFVICIEYRNSIIQKCNSIEILNAGEELYESYLFLDGWSISWLHFSFFPHRALNHIFLLQEENQQELQEHFDDELWQNIFFEIYVQYPYVAVPEYVFNLCGSVLKVMYKFKVSNE